jgi:hypothetical protein
VKGKTKTEIFINHIFHTLILELELNLWLLNVCVILYSRMSNLPIKVCCTRFTRKCELLLLKCFR